MRESLELRQLDEEIRQLAATLRNRSNAPMQHGPRYESHDGMSVYGRAIQCIHEGPNRKQEVMAGKFDKQIHTLFTSYLATKYPGASQESIQHHAASGIQRGRSLVRQVVYNVGGTAATTALTTVAPKLGISLGSYASALGTAAGLSVGSAFVPALLAALPVVGAVGATVVARRMSRDSREGRKAGNILLQILHEGPEIREFRKAIAGGTDLFAKFEELIKKSDRIPERHSNKLWTAGMLATGAVLGTAGAGSYEVGDQLWRKFTAGLSDAETWTKLVTGDNFRKELMTPFFANFPHFSTGVQELSSLGKYFWEHATAALWLRPTPS